MFIVNGYRFDRTRVITYGLGKQLLLSYDNWSVSLTFSHKHVVEKDFTQRITAKCLGHILGVFVV